MEPPWPPSWTAESRLYPRPTAILRGPTATRAIEAGLALPLVGGALAFAACEVIARRRADGKVRRRIIPAPEVAEWLTRLPAAAARPLIRTLDRLAAGRAPLEIAGRPRGLDFERPLIMGIVNATPDSFSGDGLHGRPREAIAAARGMIEQGADIIDVGGESTRPGASPVSIDEELERVMPVIEGLRGCGRPLSIDSRNAAVLRAALDAGAAIINDVSALEHDEESLGLAARRDVPVVLMHCRGHPRTMQDDPRYDDVVLDVHDDLEVRIEACLSAGIARRRILIDPGIGFGKKPGHNFNLIEHLALLHGLGCPLMLGVSRKRFVTAPGAAHGAREGIGGSLAAALAGLNQGVHVLRVHDVAETARAVAVWRALAEGA